MRKIVSIFVIPFVFLFVFAQTNFCNYTKVYASGVDDITISNYNYEFYISGKKYFYKTNDFKEYIKFSAYQKFSTGYLPQKRPFYVLYFHSGKTSSKAPERHCSPKRSEMGYFLIQD